MNRGISQNHPTATRHSQTLTQRRVVLRSFLPSFPTRDLHTLLRFVMSILSLNPCPRPSNLSTACLLTQALGTPGLPAAAQHVAAKKQAVCHDPRRTFEEIHPTN